MPIEFGCPQCLSPQKIDESKVGQHVYCRVCYFKLTVPAESTNKPIGESQLYALGSKPWDTQDKQELISFRCDICKTIISVREEQVGEEIICEECGKKMIVPKSIAEKAQARLQATLDKAAALKAPKATYSLHDGIAASADDEPKSFRFSCRLCGTALFATEEQIGTLVPCPDCETTTKVPPQIITSKTLPSPPSIFEGAAAYELANPSKTGASAQSHKNLVPVICRLCGTRMYADESQIGQSQTCPDCGQATEIKYVPKPPKITTQTTSADAYTPDKADVTAPRPTRTWRTSLSPALLRKRLNDWESCQALERPALPKRPLTERFFVPFTYIETWTLLLLFVFVVPLGVLVIAGVAIFFGGAVAVLTVGMPVGVTLVATFCYFATFLLHVYSFTSSGMDAKEFKEWLPPADYVINGFWLVTFSCIAATPGYLIGKFFVSEVLLIILMMRISHWLFFPIAFLSSMETGSMFAVFAKNTMTSLFRFPFAWFRFYFLTGTLFILADLSLIGALWFDSTGSMFFVTLTFFCFIDVIQSLFFFRFLGRLAWLLEETDRQSRELEEDQN